MSGDKMDLKQFIIALCESPHRWIREATDGLTDEQLYYQPTSDTNSIAWLIWHLSRWRDKVSASIAGEPQVWDSQGWDRRFNISNERTGLGDTLGQVAAFRPDRDTLLGYADAAHQALVQRVSRLTPEQFEQSVEYLPGSSRPAWRALASVMGDSSEHTGQINYLRGMITGHGWRQQQGGR
jgi:hypothetical protein